MTEQNASNGVAGGATAPAGATAGQGGAVVRLRTVSLPPLPNLLPTVVRHRCPAHLAWIKTLPCAVPGCRNLDIDAHHLTIMHPKARGLKAGDDQAVPLCRRPHHRQLHDRGNERGWWRAIGVDAVALAAQLWRSSVLTGRYKPTEDAR